jgi:hypothetical protein
MKTTNFLRPFSVFTEDVALGGMALSVLIAIVYQRARIAQLVCTASVGIYALSVAAGLLEWLCNVLPVTRWEERRFAKELAELSPEVTEVTSNSAPTSDNSAKLHN